MFFLTMVKTTAEMVSRGIPYGSPMGNTHLRDKMVFSEYISSIEHKKQLSILGLIFLANHLYISIMYDALQVRCAGFELRYKGGRVLDGISATQHLSQQPPCCLGEQLSWSETATNNFNNTNNTTINTTSFTSNTAILMLFGDQPPLSKLSILLMPSKIS